MKASVKLAAVSVLYLLISVASAYAQNSLFDNPNYRRSLELQRSAKTAYDAGDYLKSAEYAKEATRLSAVAREEAETQRLLWIANSWKNRASNNIAFGEKVNAPTRYPDVWPQAKEAYAIAVSEFDAARYEASTEASKKVVSLLSVVVAEGAAPAKRPAPATGTLPAFYKVRLIPATRDCFWRIAAYPFVYGNPLQWRNLYEANKDKLQDPANPDLIQPGTVLSIPSLSGEKREGTWEE